MQMHKELLGGIMATVEGYIEIEVLHKAIPDKQLGELTDLIESEIKRILTYDVQTTKMLDKRGYSPPKPYGKERQ